MTAKLDTVTVEDRAEACRSLCDEIVTSLSEEDRLSLLEKLGVLETIKWQIIKEA